MLLRHGAIYLIAVIVPGAINALGLALYSRLLSPEEYGHYTLVIAGVSIANSIIFWWFRYGLLRFLPAYKERKEELLATIGISFFILALLTGVLAATIIILIDQEPLRNIFMLGTSLLLIQAWYELNTEYVRSELSPKHYGIISLTKSLIAFVIGVTLAYMGMGAFGIILGLLLGMFITIVPQTLSVWRRIRFNQRSLRIFSQLFFYGMPIAVSVALNVVVSSSDRFLLAMLMDTDAAGLYAVGYDLAQFTLGMLMGVVYLAAYPIVVHALEQISTDAAQRYLLQSGTMLLAIAIPAAAGLALLAPNIAGVFLGAAFRDQATVLIPWISLGALFAGIKAYYFDLAFQLSGHTKRLIWVMMMAAIMNIVLNFLWIPKFGILGAAYSTVVSYAAGMVLSFIFGRKVFLVPLPKRDTVKIIICTSVMTAILITIQPLRGAGILVLQILSGTLIYAVMFLLLNVFNSRVHAYQIFLNMREYFNRQNYNRKI